MELQKLRPTLDVLVLGANPHGSHLYGRIHSALRKFPNVRAINDVWDAESAWSLMRQGDVNTIFLSPLQFACGFGGSRFKQKKDAGVFIESVRRQIPEIVFVLVFWSEDDAKYFLSMRRGRFKHYLLLLMESIDHQLPSIVDGCEKWHASMFEYDIALSFAGQDRPYAEELVRYLKTQGVRVFYDTDEVDRLWGKDLYQYFEGVYRDRARYCVVLVSSNYKDKLWPRHELKQAQARAFRTNASYLLPIRIDDSEVPGLPETIGFLDARTQSPEATGALIMQKLFFGFNETV